MTEAKRDGGGGGGGGGMKEAEAELAGTVVMATICALQTPLQEITVGSSSRLVRWWWW